MTVSRLAYFLNPQRFLFPGAAVRFGLRRFSAAFVSVILFLFRFGLQRFARSIFFRAPFAQEPRKRPHTNSGWKKAAPQNKKQQKQKRRKSAAIQNETKNKTTETKADDT